MPVNSKSANNSPVNVSNKPVSLSKNRSAAGSSRRSFLAGSASSVLGGLIVGQAWGSMTRPSRMANEKLDLAIIGVANRAADNLAAVSGENIKFLCDVDQRFLSAAKEKHGQAQTFVDYRKLLEQADQFDGVVVSTPDHHHFHASYWAIEQGKHCYCEKPLTHSVWEARTINQLAKSKGVATQMGTQIHATPNYHKVVKLIQSGAIGTVSEVHVWVGKGWGGGERPETGDPVPAYLNWEQWLGGAPKRPFKEGRYHPANWRRWWDFGGGTLGDMACHLIDLPFWALDIKDPKTVEAKGPEVHPETCPLGLQVDYEFEKDGNPVKLTWYDGDQIPKRLHDIACWGMGIFFVGSEGILQADYGNYQIYPEQRAKEIAAPELQSAPTGHHQEWINACKEGTPTGSHFGYSGPLTESVLLGNVAYRCGQKIKWNADKMTTDNDVANQLIRREYRDGWKIG